MAETSTTCDLLVIGAGPGGIAAAVTAAKAGRRVVLVDDNPQAGGQIWRNRGEGPKSGSGRKWCERLGRATSVERLSRSCVVAAIAPGVVLAETPAGPRRIRRENVVLATGARELFLPFPGWTLPGVLGAGAMQALVKSGLPVAGKRVLVAGTGPLLLAVARLLVERGATVPMIVEQASARAVRRFAWSLIRTPAKLLAGVALRAGLLGTQYATDAYPVRVAQQGGAGLRVTVRVGSREEEVACDYLACGFHLIPNVELAVALGCRLTAEGFVEVDGGQQTSVAGVYAVGELTGIGGVEKALVEGQIAAIATLGSARPGSALLRQSTRVQAFARRLDAAFALRPELFSLATPDTIVCRCEDVSLAAIEGCTSARDAKLQTRCGMGPCQGRVCGPVLRRLWGMEAPVVRPPIAPTPISVLIAAGDDREAR